MAFLIQRSFGDATAGANLTGTALIRMIAGDRLRIGRGAGCDLRLTDPGVALEHAELHQLEGGVEIVDLGSTTGTFLNGRRVQKAPAKSGDWVEIGRARIALEYGAASMPVLLNVRELDEEPARPEGGASVAAAAEGAARGPVAQIDYVATYGLASRFFDKRSLSVLGLASAVLGLGLLLWTQRLDALRPGSVSQAHASLGAKCFACHAPWVGPAEDRCVSCHAGPDHQPVPANAPSGAIPASGEPACTTCHLEHRFEDRLALVTNEVCVACHADLSVAGSVTGRFERNITDFADHPQFTVPGSADGGAVGRMRLGGDESVSDPTLLNLDHRLHLSPDRWSPEARKIQLSCQDCHAYDAATGEIAPLRFEDHCERCHPLDFDPDPRVGRAPHVTGEEVHAFLLARYVALDNPAAAASLQERRVGRRLPGDGAGGRRAPPDVTPKVLAQVTRAEYTLFRAGAHCQRCHEVSPGGVVPDVEPPNRPRPWLHHGRFEHEAHRKWDCEMCHARARESDRTEDILIPGIESCRHCHGPGNIGVANEGAGIDATPGATTRCVSCHTYHDKSKLGWEAVER